MGHPQSDMIEKIIKADYYITRFARKYAADLVGIPLCGAAIVFGLMLLLSVSPITDKYSEMACLYPPWPAAIVTGALLCALKNWEGPNRSSLFAWALPAAYLLAVLELDRASTLSAYAWKGWRDMLAHRCDGEDCFGPVLACVPLVFSLAYSATALALSFIHRKPRNPGKKCLETRGREAG